jgi:hypothetical protein
LNRRIVEKLLTLPGFTGSGEDQFLAFVEYFKTERSADDVKERFSAFTTPEALRLFEALGHYGTNARTATGLCRWLIEYFGLKLVSRQHRVEGIREMVYQIDAEILAYRLERARQAAANRQAEASKNIDSEAKYIFLDTPQKPQRCQKPAGTAWRERLLPKLPPRPYIDLSKLVAGLGTSKFNPFSPPVSEATP